jgi:hypothetical protein
MDKNNRHNSHHPNTQQPSRAQIPQAESTRPVDAHTGRPRTNLQAREQERIKQVPWRSHRVERAPHGSRGGQRVASGERQQQQQRLVPAASGHVNTPLPAPVARVSSEHSNLSRGGPRGSARRLTARVPPQPGPARQFPLPRSAASAAASLTFPSLIMRPLQRREEGTGKDGAEGNTPTRGTRRRGRPVGPHVSRSAWAPLPRPDSTALLNVQVGCACGPGARSQMDLPRVALRVAGGQLSRRPERAAAPATPGAPRPERPF